MKRPSAEELRSQRTEDVGTRDNMVLFLGTERGLAVLQRLIRDQIGTIAAVCVQDASGHGAEATQRIQEMATEIGANVTSASKLAPTEYATFIQSHDAVTALCINWRRLFPNNALYASTRGLVVAHDSVLPHLRGFAPLNHGIRNGEDETGVTLFYAESRTDAGDIIGQRRTQIGSDEYVNEVRGRVTQLTVDLVADVLPQVLRGTVVGTPQDESKATYGVRLTPTDGKMDFTRPARDLYNLIRATSHPYPGAFAHIGPRQKILRIWAASIPDDTPQVGGGIPGRVIQSVPGRGVFVCTGNGALLLEQVQLEGHPAVQADKLIRHYTTTLY